MSASEIGQKVEFGGKNAMISTTRALNSSKNLPLPSCGIQAIKAASAVSFEHHP